MPNPARLRDPDATSGDRKKAIALHLLGFTMMIWFPVVPALVLWLITKDDSPFVADHGKEAVNFQISLVLYALLASALAVVLIGFPMMVGVGVLGLVGILMAVFAAKDSEYFRYPMCLRLIK